MYSFELTQKFLCKEEQEIFNVYLESLGLDADIWQVFSHLFKTSEESTEPYLLKAYKNSELQGVIVLLRCKKYGKSLFDNKLLKGIVDLLSIPIFLWIKLGCGMDMVSNPGFVKYSKESQKIFNAMISYMKKENKLLIVNDYTHNYKHYKKSSSLPALPHGLIDTSLFNSLDDYLSNFKNIKRKIRVFKNKGGECDSMSSRLHKEQLSELIKCFISTTSKSVFYLPYQDLYFKLATTSITSNESVLYFITTLNGKIVGYQAALNCGDSLKVLHGAFDRDKKTLHHAYDVLFVKMTEFALQNKLKNIDYGVVINSTKQRMVNTSKDMSYFLMAKYTFIQSLFKKFLKLTKIQGTNQMRFKCIVFIVTLVYGI